MQAQPLAGCGTNMSKSATFEAIWRTGKGKLLVLWFGLDAVLYLGALMTLVLSLTDTSVRPFTYAFTIALVSSWALRMAFGIWLELRRVREVEKEKARKLGEILQKHGLSEGASAAVLEEIKGLE
jgi:hypothetical protein